MFAYRFVGPLLRLLAISLTGLLSCAAMAQQSYQRPAVIDQKKAYKALVRNDPEQQLVELRTYTAELVYDIRYATANNFTGQALYPTETRVCYLRKPAAEALSRVAASLRQKGWGLKIFDAYRPFGVTELFWRMIGDERYVANPAKGSGHNRGIAVDLTLIDLNTQQELEMGTGFDNFSDTAHHSFTALSAQVLQHRRVLREAMMAQGFMPLETEWWHYALPDGARFPLLNIPFKKLER
jgi:D-alanyl-D-alanine dipeptidase